jgi:hypothetical protein
MGNLIDKCLGCERVKKEDPDTCGSYGLPESKWTNGNCPLATHVKKEEEKKKNVDPIKASKRAAAGK